MQEFPSPVQAHPAMSATSPRTAMTPAMRLARKAWKLQFMDADRSMELAGQALQRAEQEGDTEALGWAMLTRGFHLMRYSGPREADRELKQAELHLAEVGERRGELLALAGRARCLWMRGKAKAALDRVLPLRAEALSILRQEERGVFLNVIAGGYSSLGESAQAFAYMFQGLRESSPTRNRGFDVVLYCNLAHELYQLGDYHQALSYLEEGLGRATELNNPRLNSVLLLNRIISLTDLGRAEEALADIREALFLASGVSQHDAAYEAMAVAALRAGEVELGRELVERAATVLPPDALPDARVELGVARAELARLEGDLPLARSIMEEVVGDMPEGVSLRMRSLVYRLLTDLQEELGDTAAALQSLRVWQTLHLERAEMASLARHQAASLQTELLRLMRQRDESEARRRATERARQELEEANRALARKISEVEALQEELRQQAVRDVLTGLFNRRQLNDILPTLVARARRDREALAVAILDMDHFKGINDRLGHLEGDRVLAAFGALLTRRLRKGDVACRYGGEEFCLLLPQTDAEGARRKLTRLLREWKEAEGVTFSAGVTDTLRVAGDAEPLLKSADDAVLVAKKAGRSQVVMADWSPG